MTIEYHIFKSNGTGANIARQYSFFFISAGLDQTDATNLTNLIEAYLDEIGAGVVAP